MQRNDNHEKRNEEKSRALLAACVVQPSPDLAARILAQAHQVEEANEVLQPVTYQPWVRGHRLSKVFSTLAAWWYERLIAVRIWAQPLSPTWHDWAETLADTVLIVLNTSAQERQGLHAAYQASFNTRNKRQLLLDSLERYGVTPRGKGRTWTPDVLTMIQQEVLPFLRMCQARRSPADTVRSLSPAQRAELVKRLHRRAHRFRRPVAEEHHLMEAFTRCLLGETSGNGQAGPCRNTPKG